MFLEKPVISVSFSWDIYYAFLSYQGLRFSKASRNLCSQYNLPKAYILFSRYFGRTQILSFQIKAFYTNCSWQNVLVDISVYKTAFFNLEMNFSKRNLVMEETNVHFAPLPLSTRNRGTNQRVQRFVETYIFPFLALYIVSLLKPIISCTLNEDDQLGSRTIELIFLKNRPTVIL